MWSLFQYSINLCIYLLLIWCKKRGNQSFSSSLLDFQRCVGQLGDVVLWVCPGVSSQSAKTPPGESLHDAEEQHFDSKALLGHWAPHTFMSESSCHVDKPHPGLLHHLSFTFCSDLVTKNQTCALWLILNDYSHCTQSHGPSFLYMIHDT